MLLLYMPQGAGWSATNSLPIPTRHSACQPPSTIARARESAAVVRRTGARRHLLLARSAAETANDAVERMVLLGLTACIISNFVVGDSWFVRWKGRE